MNVEVGSGDGPQPPPGGGSKRRQARSPERPSLTVYGGGGGGPPPGGPHAVIAPALLQTNAAIVEGMRELFRQNHQLAQGALLMEQDGKASEAARAVKEAQGREETMAMIREGLGGMHAAVASASASAQRAHEQSNSIAQQFLLALEDVRRGKRPIVNVTVTGGQPPPPPPPGTEPLERRPAQPPNRGQLALADAPAPAVKRASSSRPGPADDLAKRERKVQGSLAIAAAAGAAAGPEHPSEVPASSSAGPEYKTPERLAPLAAARQASQPAALPPRAARKIEAAGFDIQGARRNMVGVNAGVALGGDTSGSRPTVPHLREAARRNEPFRGTAHRLGSDPPTRRLTKKTPVAARARTRSRSVKA